MPTLAGARTVLVKSTISDTRTEPIATSLPQPLIAIPSFLFIEAFRPILPVGLGLAAGAMIWMVISELIPDALEETKKEHVAAISTFGVAAMISFQVLIG